MAKRKSPKSVETITHDEASRRNIPTAEYQSVMEKADQSPIQVAYQRRNRDLDPQLVWRGKDEQDWSDLVVQAPPLFIQEKVHPKVLIDDLQRRSQEREQAADEQLDLFADFNGLPDDNARTEFYRHDANWSNRMILGDSLQVMASLAEREGLRGKVQCIYLDPPYGIKFNSNFQWSTTSRDVRDGKPEHITREPEQVKAFRDTWRDGIHSYLTYLRDRLSIARDLLAESGSVFVQIGGENVHRVRALMDEVFGEANFCSSISFKKTVGQTSQLLATTFDHILWYARKIQVIKHRNLFRTRTRDEEIRGYPYAERTNGSYYRLREGNLASPTDRKFGAGDTTSQTGNESSRFKFIYRGNEYLPSGSTRGWTTSREGLERVAIGGRLLGIGNTLVFRRYVDGFPTVRLTSTWEDTIQSTFAVQKTYVVETAAKVIERCILMTTDPGDLVMDPTCGSGTTAYVAERRGRRWITIDTSRVALALARSRVMGARYPYFLLADSPAGRQKEAELTQTVPSDGPTGSDIRQGFVYERVPHITLKSIANNAEIDVIWERLAEDAGTATGGSERRAWAALGRSGTSRGTAATRGLRRLW